MRFWFAIDGLFVLPFQSELGNRTNRCFKKSGLYNCIHTRCGCLYWSKQFCVFLKPNIKNVMHGALSLHKCVHEFINPKTVSLHLTMEEDRKNQELRGGRLGPSNTGNHDSATIFLPRKKRERKSSHLLLCIIIWSCGLAKVGEFCCTVQDPWRPFHKVASQIKFHFGVFTSWPNCKQRKVEWVPAKFPNFLAPPPVFFSPEYCAG